MRRFAVRDPESGTPYDREPKRSRARQAAVLVVLYRNVDLHVLLTRRTESLNDHAGQISFPGGSKETGDGSLQQTAVRETKEELSLPAEEFEMVGELASIYIPPSHFRVTPFVAIADPIPPWTIDPAEVREVIEAPLPLLLDPRAIEEEVWDLRGTRYIVPFFRIGENKVWGATACMLSVLLAALRGV